MSFDAFLRERAALTAYARSRLPDGVEAQDVVADVFERALERDWSVIENPRAWLFRVLRSKLADVHRQHRRESARAQSLTAESDIQRMESSFDDPAGASCDCITGWLEHEAPPQLDALQRIALDDQSASDAATQLGISRGTFDVRLHRARRRSRALLAERCGITTLREARDCDCHDGCSSEPARANDAPGPD